MIARPLTSNCEKLFEENSHICFGVSPFNSYFTEERLRELARFGRQMFRSMHFFVPDVPSAHTLEALGYPRVKAEAKARQQANYTRNRITKALSATGMSLPEIWRVFVGWKELSENSRFLELYDAAQQLFESDLEFRAECLEASRWVLEKRLSSEEMTEEKLLCAVKYLLAEIPLFADAAGILGVESSVFCYHQTIPFLNRLYGGLLAFPVSRRQGFLVVTTEADMGTTGKDAIGLTSATSPCDPGIETIQESVNLAQ